MKITESQLREIAKKEVMKERKERLRKIIKEEMQKEGMLKENEQGVTLTLSNEMDAQSMLNSGEKFTVIGFTPDDVQIEYIDELNLYRAQVTTNVDGNIPEKTLKALAQIAVPKLSEKAIQKNSRAIEAIKSKGKTITSINQTLKLFLPQNMEVQYK